MSLKEILAAQSVWTYDIIGGSTVLAEVIREDALTSVNLVAINNQIRTQGINLATTSFQGARLEKEYGADWLWVLENQAYLAQAKKLDVAVSVDQMSYTIDIEQLQNLRLMAQTMTKFYGRTYQPVYVFYNSLLPAEFTQADWGCTFVSAEDVYQFFAWAGKLTQDVAKLPFSEIKVRMKPWYLMFDTGTTSTGTTVVPVNHQTDASRAALAAPW